MVFVVPWRDCGEPTTTNVAKALAPTLAMRGTA